MARQKLIAKRERAELIIRICAEARMVVLIFDMDPSDCIEIKRGRPAKAEACGQVEWKTMKLPLPIWLAMEEIAREQNLSVHEAIRIASVEWIKRQCETQADVRSNAS